MMVCSDLMFRGYSVFRSMSPTCKCDLIAMKDSRLIRVEVKTGVTNLRGDVKPGGYLKPENFDSLAIVLGSKITYRSPRGEDVSEPIRCLDPIRQEKPLQTSSGLQERPL